MQLLEADIAIIGGGMVGASLAALLPDHLKVILIESFPLPSKAEGTPLYQPSYDSRSSALSYSTYEIFHDAGIWDTLEKYAQPIHDVHVSDRGHWGSTLLSDEVEGMKALGYVVENSWLGRTLLNALQQKENITFCCPATVEKVKPQADGVELSVMQGEEKIIVHAGLAVVADGARSKICESLGIYTHIEDYGHVGIIANVSTSEPHKGIAYERFTDAGPMALLPLIDAQDASEDNTNRSALVWTLPTAQAKELMEASDDEFLKQLQIRFGHRQGSFVKVGVRHSYPLMLSTAAEQVRQNIVVLGNAAHSLHPVAGQGFNLALRDVKMLCDILKNQDAQGKRLGELAVLQTYVEKQKLDQVVTSMFSDVLPNLFSSKKNVIKAGRGIGLVGLELMPGMKSSFVKFATGMRNISGAS